jgi:hypothetical protein
MKMFNAVIVVLVLVLVLLMGAREGFVAGYPKNDGGWGTKEMGSATSEEECRTKVVNDGTGYIFRKSNHSQYPNTCIRMKYGCNPMYAPTMLESATHSTGCTKTDREFPNCAKANCDDFSTVEAWRRTLPVWLRW